MGIKSRAFSGVKLTGDDAAKFRNQVTFGRPKPAAKVTIERGQSMVREMARTGRFVFTPSKPAGRGQ